MRLIVLLARPATSEGQFLLVAVALHVVLDEGFVIIGVEPQRATRSISTKPGLASSLRERSPQGGQSAQVRMGIHFFREATIPLRVRFLMRQLAELHHAPESDKMLWS